MQLADKPTIQKAAAGQSPKSALAGFGSLGSQLRELALYLEGRPGCRELAAAQLALQDLQVGLPYHPAVSRQAGRAKIVCTRHVEQAPLPGLLLILLACVPCFPAAGVSATAAGAAEHHPAGHQAIGPVAQPGQPAGPEQPVAAF